MDPINEADVGWETTERGDARFRRKRLGAAAGGEKLGCSRYELPPGATSWPYHYHTGNEEALYVLSGHGVLRAADGEYDLESGDYVAFPADEEGGHQLRNESEEPFSYLLVSTMNDPDVSVYPDDGKIGIFAGAPPGSREERTVEGYFRLGETVDYWETER
ncbi:cupin domain-containing protein [Haloferacaceae archaeon DSL9]